MGDMIRFGIKVGLTVATAVLLVAAIALLFAQIASITISGGSSFNTIVEVGRFISLFLPINFALVFTIVTALFGFKIAYWSADKMLWLIDVLG